MAVKPTPIFPVTTQAPAEPLSVLEDATGNRFITYETKEGTQIEVHFDGEDPWFTQKDIAAMFGVAVSDVSRHIKRYNEDGEIDNSVIAEFTITASDGKTYPTKHYSLDVAFYVGYRVNSTEGKLFRRWATRILKQVATHGYVIDKGRLRGDLDRLREIRKIIADIRSDEATMYAELREICAMCPDYDPASAAARNFFAHFQNRMLYAITENTSAMLIKKRADAAKPNMGLITWKGRNITQDDATVAKNYLGDLELEDLNSLVGMVLDFFEGQAKRGWLVTMDDAEGKLGEILAVNKRHMLQGFGKAKAEDAEQHAIAEYKKFKAARKAGAIKEIGSALSAIKALPKPRTKPAKK
jgi:hypothetical protein